MYVNGRQGGGSCAALECRRWQEASVVESEVERWRTKARETAAGLMAQEIEAAISQAAKARCRELEAQCEAKCKDIEAAVEARVIAQAQAEFGRVYAELQARCKAESEAAVEARIDDTPQAGHEIDDLMAVCTLPSIHCTKENRALWYFCDHRGSPE